MDFEGVTESNLNSQYYLILRKIELASKISNEENISNTENGEVIIKQNNGNFKYEGIFKGGILYDGTDNWHRENGDVLYSLKFKNGEIISGKYINIFIDKYELIFDGQFNHSNELVNGYTTIFYSPNKIKYQGYIKDGEYDGEGRFYSEKNSLRALFSGIWKEGEKISGEYINNKSNNITYFKGEYSRNKPYTGKIKFNDLYKFNDSYGFEGMISEGKIVDGKGYKFSRHIVSEEYKNLNPWSDFDIEEYDNEDYEYFYSDIPYEVGEEMARDSARAQIQHNLDYLKQNYGHVVELIGAEWINGEPILNENDLLNKTHFYYNNSKKNPDKK